jgi:hypothetical protein
VDLYCVMGAHRLPQVGDGVDVLGSGLNDAIRSHRQGY